MRINFALHLDKYQPKTTSVIGLIKQKSSLFVIRPLENQFL